MVYRGIDPEDEFLFILPEDAESSDPVKTEFWLHPQTARIGNKSVAQYMKAGQKKGIDEVAAETTKGDRRNFHAAISRIKNFQFREDDEPTPEILNEDTKESRVLLNKVFAQLDISSLNKIMNASREPKLSESEKKESSSLSGQDSFEKIPEASDLTVPIVKS